MTDYLSHGLIFSITTLRYPEVEPVRLHRLTQFTGGKITIELDELRLAEVTVSIYDDCCEDILPLERFLHVRYLGKPVFWGPILEPHWDYTNGTVTINAIDEGQRMVKHFVRIGDDVEADGFATVDSRGVLLLRDCALNISSQTDRGVPDLGIVDGDSDVPDSDIKLKVTRGDEVWGTIKKLSESLDNPFEVELDPQEIDEGSYSHLNTWVKQGVDRTGEDPDYDALLFHFGWGLDNLSAFDANPSGSAVITHDHVLSQDLAHRGTAAAEGPSARFGPWVNWDALDRNVDPTEADPDAVLAGFGKGTVLVYGEPPKFSSFTTRLQSPDPASPIMPRYGVEFLVGDLCKVVAKRGKGYYNEKARIRKVTLNQTNSSVGTIQADVEAVPTILTPDDVTSTED